MMARFEVEGNDAPDDADVLESVDRELALAFAPVHKGAFGVAIGTAAGVSLFVAAATIAPSVIRTLWWRS